MSNDSTEKRKGEKEQGSTERRTSKLEQKGGPIQRIGNRGQWHTSRNQMHE